MTVQRFYPADWDAMRAAILDWTIGSVGSAATVVWGEQNAPRPAKPYVVLRLLSSPISIGQAVESNQRAIRVEAAQESTAYEVTIGSTTYVHVTPGSGATLTSIRDGLIEAINGVHPGPASAATIDTIALDIAGNLDLEVGDQDLLAVKLLQSYAGMAELVIEIDGYADDRDVLAGVIDGLKLDTEVTSSRERLAAGGLAFVGPVASRRLSVVVNGLWEHRYGFDVRMRAPTRRIEVIDLIERADLGEGVMGTLAL